MEKVLTAAPSRPQIQEEERVRRRKKWIAGAKPWLFLLPTLALLGWWMVKPLIQTLMYTLCDWNMLPGTAPVFVGFANFVRLLQMPEFPIALGNTLYYIVMLLPFSVVLPILIASATQSLGTREKKVFRALIFLPMIMPPVAVSTVFQWMFHPTNGIVNHVLVTLGLVQDPINFFQTEGVARFVIVLITGWKMMGFSALMFSAAIGGINREYYEASRLDGAGSVRRFFDITVPLLSPTILLMVMMSILFASQWTFTYIDVLTQGGPYSTSTNIYYMIYKFAFGDSNVGLSAAASLVFLVVFGVVALILQAVSRKLAFYDN